MPGETVFFFQDICSGLHVKGQSSLNVVTEENVRGNNARKLFICLSQTQVTKQKFFFLSTHSNEECLNPY